MAKYRMYSLVLRQLSPMQKGVQASHSMMDYAFKFHKRTEFIHWANVDKTVIILDGGTYPELKECRDFLNELEVPFTCFYEEDLGDLMTSISFILEDKIWDTKSYPTYEDELCMPFLGDQVEDTGSSEGPDWLKSMGGLRNLKLRNFIFSKKLSQ